jgi:putative oxidoreductase
VYLRVRDVDGLTYLGALLLVVFLVPTAVLMHGFWKESDPQAHQMEMV